MIEILRWPEAGVAAVRRAAAVLRRPGAVVAVPTETVYGLVGRVAEPSSAERIYALKARDARKPLTWFVADWRVLARYGVDLTGYPEQLAARYCPGAITILAPGPGPSGIGFRIPDHDFVLALLRELDEPLFSTSANLSGEPNALNLADALSGLTGPVDLAVDGGAVPDGALASTVVDCRGNEPKILRRGPLTVRW